jgi:hypothetical protein
LRGIERDCCIKWPIKNCTRRNSLGAQIRLHRPKSGKRTVTCTEAPIKSANARPGDRPIATGRALARTMPNKAFIVASLWK